MFYNLANWFTSTSAFVEDLQEQPQKVHFNAIKKFPNGSYFVTSRQTGYVADAYGEGMQEGTKGSIFKCNIFSHCLAIKE